MHDPRHVTPEILAAVSAAFAARDVEGIVEGIVESFVEDGVFVNGKGPAGGGDTYAGKAAIRAFFTELFRITPEVQWVKREPAWMFGDKVVTQWQRKAVLASGEKQEWGGADLYTFRNGKIVRKDTYVKVVSPPA